MESFDDSDLYGDLYDTVDESKPAAPETSAQPGPTSAGEGQPSASEGAPAAGSSTLSPPPGAGLPAIPQQGAPMHFDAEFAKRQRAERDREADTADAGKMFIGGLNWDTTDEGMRTYFEQFGVVNSCNIMRDNETKRSRGFGFLTFADASSVAAVMARDHYLDGKNIDPKRAVPRSEAAKSDKLFVRALPQTCTQESFRAYWRNFGQISDATLMMDKETGRHRGFGFVNYENSEAVEKVLSSGPHVMDGQTLEVKRAQTKSDNQNNNQGPIGNNRGNFNNGGNNMPYRPAPMGGMGGGMGMGGPPMGANMGGAMGGPPGGAGGAPFDPQAMAKFFQQMGWGAFNPMMMMGPGMFGGAPGANGAPGGFGGMGMGVMPNMMGGMGGMGMPGMGMGGMPGMGGMGMGFDPSQMGGMGGMGGASPAGAGGDGAPGAGGDGPNAGANAGAGGGVSPFTGPMHQQPMRGGMGGARGGRGGFHPPSGPASMRHGGGDGGAGAGPQRSAGRGQSFHPYQR